MKAKKKSLANIIDELAKKEGCPGIKLDYSTYMQVLKQAQAKWLLSRN